MKNMFKAWAILALFTLSLSANAAFVFGNDVFKFTGDAYLDISGPVTQGIGRVSTITQGGSVIWSSGDAGEYLNFVFGNYNPVIAPVAPIFNFLANGGFVDFYTTNNAALFNTALSPAAEMAAIQAGSLFLSTVGNGDTIGIATGTSYSANGFLDVTGGVMAAQLDTNNRPTFLPGVFSDLSFGLVGSNNQNPLVNPLYTYITSADAQGAAVAIPEPGILMLLGLGLIGLAIYTDKRNVRQFHLAV